MLNLSNSHEGDTYSTVEPCVHQLYQSVLTSGVGAVVSVKGWHTMASVVDGVARTTKQAKVVTTLAGISRSCTQGNRKKTETIMRLRSFFLSLCFP